MANITDNEELMDIFYEETQSLIDQMRCDLSTLSQEDETRLDRPDVLHSLFRCAHIIKTSSASVGLDDLNKVTETLEKVFKMAGDEKFAMTDDIISLFSECVDTCQKLLNGDEQAGLKELLDRLNCIFQTYRG